LGLKRKRLFFGSSFLVSVKKSAHALFFYRRQVCYGLMLDGFMKGVEADVRDALSLTDFFSFESSIQIVEHILFFRT
jgi:hypothetical protein